MKSHVVVFDLCREPTELHATAPAVHDAATDATAEPRHASTTSAADWPEQPPASSGGLTAGTGTGC